MDSRKKLSVTVLGLWHLGSVTAACCAECVSVIGLDFDQKTVSDLNKGVAPIDEPGLNELLRKGLKRKRLQFTTNAKEVCANSDILWVCYDTPVDENDRPNSQFVLDQLKLCLPHLQKGTTVLISSQLPIGTCKKLEAEYSSLGLSFAYSPENLKLGNALEAFKKPERIILGVRDTKAKRKLTLLLNFFCERILFMRPESAEMTKHALNSFLALSITYMNEIARLCELTGADAKEVEEGLKTDIRIGQRAYLSPGQAFSGGTLARDVVSLHEVSEAHDEELILIPSIKKSNDAHKDWAFKRLVRFKKQSGETTVALLGLTYKPFTNTLRRSSAVELCERLLNTGFTVKAFDPAVTVKDLPSRIQKITLCDRPEEVFQEADVIVISTPWPNFKKLAWANLLKKMRRQVILDPASFLRGSLEKNSEIQYFAVGVSS